MKVIAWLLFSIVLVVVFAARVALGAEVELAWDASPSPNVVAYILKQGPTSGVYTSTMDVGPRLTAKATNLIPGRTVFVVTARNDQGLESVPSNEVGITIPLAPPVNLANRNLVRTWTIPPGALLQRWFNLSNWSEHIRNTGTTPATIRVSEDGFGRVAFFRLWTNQAALPPLPGGGR